MSISWVAGVVRCKALAQRRIGPGGSRTLAASPGLPEAVTALCSTPYGHDVRDGMTLAQAQHAIGASLLWNMRVLVGWLPREGADVIRLLAAGFEVANLDEHLASIDGGPHDASYRLGTLETAWSRLSATTTVAGAAEVLGASSWRLRDITGRRELQVGLRLAWADAVAARVPEAAPWARTGAALLVLRGTALEGRRLPPQLARRAANVLGAAFVEAVSAGERDVSALRAQLRSDARWTLDGLDRVEDLWRAEASWWRRVEHDGFALLRGASYDRGPVVGAVAVLAVDAWRTCAALESAARGGDGAALEAFDGVA